MSNGLFRQTGRANFRRLKLACGRVTIVDTSDYERLIKFRWYAMKTRNNIYVIRHEASRLIKMHHDIIRPGEGFCVDHKNHDTLDNRRCNLRICTPAQNCYNKIPSGKGTSRYKGVHWRVDIKKWCASIGFNGKIIHIGLFDYEPDAALAYDDRAAELFGEFACLNCQYRPEVAQWLKDCWLFSPIPD